MEEREERVKKEETKNLKEDKMEKNYNEIEMNYLLKKERFEVQRTIVSVVNKTIKVESLTAEQVQKLAQLIKQRYQEEFDIDVHVELYKDFYDPTLTIIKVLEADERTTTEVMFLEPKKEA